MSGKFFFLIYLLSSQLVYAMITGSPAEPAILKKMEPWWSIRVGYLSDWIYKYDLKDEFQFEFELEDEDYRLTNLELTTYAGTFTFNILNRIDLYTILGGSKMKLDEEVYSKRAFSWGLGAKFVALEFGNFFFGGDGKYFKSNQKPQFFLVDEEAYNIKTNYTSAYEEWQGSLGIAYRIKSVVPYVNFNYISTRIEPSPPIVLVLLPDIDELADVELKPVVSKEDWGMALGFSIVDQQKMEIALEWRHFNQNAVNLSAQFRF